MDSPDEHWLATATVAVGLRWHAGILEDRLVGDIPRLLQKIWETSYNDVEAFWCGAPEISGYDQQLRALMARWDVLRESCSVSDDDLASLRKEVLLTKNRCQWNSKDDVIALRTLFPVTPRLRCCNDDAGMGDP
ncbi:hypothetical protein GSS87_00870 [Corynebacterium sp. 4HC-13]|uniref:Uncharacterized protein n=1 Tax=Corynebacterium anserum TaxID=2684406 RepID=A0A7G7YMB1_9CORY|nr:hypothetical protein [Corynebacterium anserum]MBC2680988.1 hypothetical protein [Corynebacterium anserum]QNH95631.1 hypothetical protein GP473_02080 [Corynebacterium anserum]